MSHSPGELLYKVERFDVGGAARFIMCRKSDGHIPISISLFEAHLSDVINPLKGTAGAILQGVAYLYSWAQERSYNIEAALFSGAGVQYPDVEDYSNWINNLQGKNGALSAGYKNGIMIHSRKIVLWFVRRYLRCSRYEELNVFQDRHLSAHRSAWKDFCINVKGDLNAECLSVDEFRKLEDYFSLSKESYKNLSARALRNYIIWLLAWEFGLRIGEILALRNKDIHLIGCRKWIDIVRVDQRGLAQTDPRSPYAPKVKTQPRELGFLHDNSLLPMMLEFYQKEHRKKICFIRGKEILSPFLNHNYLLINHDGSGAPLSQSAAAKIAARAKVKTGCRFKWHIVRHTFFNRYYALATCGSETSITLENLVYWGGWVSTDSLFRYSRFAVARKAKFALMSRGKTLDNCEVLFEFFEEFQL